MLDLFEREPVLENNRKLAHCLRELTADLNDHPHVAEVRQCGMILALEMIKEKSPRTPYPWQERRGLKVYRHVLSRSVLLRPIGNVVYILPPYVITPEQIAHAVTVAREGIDLATRD